MKGRTPTVFVNGLPMLPVNAICLSFVNLLPFYVTLFLLLYYVGMLPCCLVHLPPWRLVTLIHCNLVTFLSPWYPVTLSPSCHLDTLVPFWPLIYLSLFAISSLMVLFSFSSLSHLLSSEKTITTCNNNASLDAKSDPFLLGNLPEIRILLWIINTGTSHACRSTVLPQLSTSSLSG